MSRLIGTLVGAICLTYFLNIDLLVARFFYYSFDLNSHFIQQFSFWTDYLPLTLFVFVCFYLIKRFTNRVTYAELTVSVLFYSICGMFSLLLKNLIGRARPVFEADGIYQFSDSPQTFHFLAEYDWNFASMPSGHAMVSLSIALAFSRFYPRFSILFWLLALLITASRLVFAVHWLTDILSATILVLLMDRLLWNQLEKRLIKAESIE